MATREEVEAKVKRFIQDHSGNEVTDMETPFVEMNLDSLDGIEIIMECESEWDIEIQDHEMEALQTPKILVNKILDMIH